MRMFAFRQCTGILILLSFGSAVSNCRPAAGCTQVHRLAEMNTEQIRALDRQKTVILLPGGILEEHGPYLPSYTDGCMSERLTDDLANAIAARPGWSVVVFPVIPLGSGGANEMGARFPFPGPKRPRLARRGVVEGVLTERAAGGEGSPDNGLAAIAERRFFVLT